MFLSVVIPTFGREETLLDTINYLLNLNSRPDEILVVDQTTNHKEETLLQLDELSRKERIRWIRMYFPSITKAMNVGLRKAKGDRVLYLDDDIIPDKDLIRFHRKTGMEREFDIVAGRVLQPWHNGLPDDHEDKFLFNSLIPREVLTFMGGNVSLPRRASIDIGGFDTNFVKVAYHFEAEFAYRWRRNGFQIYYEPNALIHHLRAERGGTRTFGQHLTTLRPDHSVGKYYFYYCTKGIFNGTIRSILSLAKSVSTKHHLRNPFWIPATLVAEVRGLIWAFFLQISGKGLIDGEVSTMILVQKNPFIALESMNQNLIEFLAKNEIFPVRIDYEVGQIRSGSHKSQLKYPSLIQASAQPTCKPDAALLVGKTDFLALTKCIGFAIRNIPIIYFLDTITFPRTWFHTCLDRCFFKLFSIVVLFQGDAINYLHFLGMPTSRVVAIQKPSSDPTHLLAEGVIESMNRLCGAED